MRGHIEIYTDRHGEWRWRFRTRNGNITAVSSEGYERRGGAVRGARATVGSLARIKDVEWRDESEGDSLDQAGASVRRASSHAQEAQSGIDDIQDSLDDLRGLTGEDRGGTMTQQNKDDRKAER